MEQHLNKDSLTKIIEELTPNHRNRKTLQQKTRPHHIRLSPQSAMEIKRAKSSRAKPANAGINTLRDRKQQLRYHKTRLSTREK
jgi:hypothetical protein